MSATIVKGYLINQIDYQVFDEIITILDEVGRRIVCYAPGVKKINSKNKNSLLLGNFNEFEVFLSLTEWKISKLKKTTSIREIDWELLQNDNAIILFKLSNSFFTYGKDQFLFFDKYINKLNKTDDPVLLSEMIRDFMMFSGVSFKINSCVLCNKKKIKTVSFIDGGLICDDCFDPKRHVNYDIDFCKYIYYIFANDLEKAKKYSHYAKAVNLELLRFVNSQLGVLLPKNLLKNI